MRLLKKQISAKDGEGLVKLLVEEPEDLYHVFHLVCKGDYVRASTVRKVVLESNTGSVQSRQQRMNLTLEVDKVEYEPGSDKMRVSGRNREENPHVRLGANHTLELEVTRDFMLRKNRWDEIFLERLKNATDLTKRAEVAAVVMDMGYALVCLVTEYMTVVRSKIDTHIPKKRNGDTRNHQKGVSSFYTAVLESLLRNVEVSIIKCVLVASPGFVKDDFAKFVDGRIQSCAQGSNTDLVELRKKFLLVHSSSGHKHALSEVLAKPEVQLQMQDTRAAEEVVHMDKFFELLNTDEDRAPYGVAHVRRALDANAVETLLVCDDLFRNATSVSERHKYVQMVENARASNTKVVIFSRMHVSGEQLAGLSGVAAILRYAMPHLQDQVEQDQVEQEEQVPPDAAKDDSQVVASMVEWFL